MVNTIGSEAESEEFISGMRKEYGRAIEGLNSFHNKLSEASDFASRVAGDSRYNSEEKKAVLSHVGKEMNRMYSEVADLLQSMKKTMEKSGVFSIKISGPHIQ
jgi:hypothetical protein